jgi:hypothetical protein
MLDYVKTVLIKVSFDQKLFRRELEKSLQWLETEDILNLKNWVVEKFNHMYKDIISDVFYSYELSPVSLN